MAEEIRLTRPWLVAVWPGMGHVALNAGYYLIAKLGMHLIAEFEAHGLFDVEQVEVQNGLIRPGHLPRSRSFAWRDPKGRRDLVVFIGEAQPPVGKYAFCQKLVEFARGIDVDRVFTFAAMATPMHPSGESRVFAAATDQAALDELNRPGVEILENGHIGGLNGVLLGVAAEAGLRGGCLLGEMPHIFAQLPFPKASLSVLEVFAHVTGIEIDFTELSKQAEEMERGLGELLEQIQQATQSHETDEEEPAREEPARDEGLGSEDEQRIERLFDQAGRDRAAAYELKRELDRLGVYRQYENRFLDLFKSSP